MRVKALTSERNRACHVLRTLDVGSWLFLLHFTTQSSSALYWILCQALSSALWIASRYDLCPQEQWERRERETQITTPLLCLLKHHWLQRQHLLLEQCLRALVLGFWKSIEQSLHPSRHSVLLCFISNQSSWLTADSVGPEHSVLLAHRGI